MSTAPTEWFQQVREYMPSVEHYGVPDQIRLGEPFVISGAGYHEGDRVELSIEFIDQSKLDVPREAIVIEVGCDGIHPWPIDPGEPPDEAFLRAADYSLDVVSQAPYGETVEMKLTLRNAGDGTVSFVLGGRPPYDFVASTTDGDLVWHWMCAKFALASLGNETLEPGEELEFIGEWEQIDNRGEPVPPGVYSVRAVLNLDPPEKLVTEARELEVLE